MRSININIASNLLDQLPHEAELEHLPKTELGKAVLESLQSLAAADMIQSHFTGLNEVGTLLITFPNKKLIFVKRF